MDDAKCGFGLVNLFYLQCTSFALVKDSMSQVWNYHKSSLTDTTVASFETPGKPAESGASSESEENP